MQEKAAKAGRQAGKQASASSPWLADFLTGASFSLPVMWELRVTPPWQILGAGAVNVMCNMVFGVITVTSLSAVMILKAIILGNALHDAGLVQVLCWGCGYEALRDAKDAHPL